MKATLQWWEPSFDPKKDGGHDLHKISEMIREKVPAQDNFAIPGYLCDQKYQSLSRYPAGGLGFGVPFTLLSDVDRLFADFIEMVPFQFNSQLFWTLLYPDDQVSPAKKMKYKNHYEALTLNNEQMKRLYTHVVTQGTLSR